MNRFNPFRILLLALLVICAGKAYAQEAEGQLDGYTPPPMFQGTPKAPDPAISFPIEQKTISSAVNPADEPAPASAVPAEATVSPAQEAAPKRSSLRKIPPVPPQRPSTLVASEAYIQEQKRLDAEKAAAALAEKVQSQIDIAKDPDAPVSEPAIAELPKAQETAPAPAEKPPEPVEEPPRAVAEPVIEPPPIPAAPQPSPAMNQKLMGQELANPSIEEIFEALEGKPLKTPLPQGPKDPGERMIIVRSTPDSGPSIRIHAKRPTRKKETAHAFFIVFEPGVTEITDLGKNNFEKKILPILNENPDFMLQIQAYAKPDAKGVEEAQRVSLARANSIRMFFLERNISPSRIQIHALGALTATGTADRVDIMLIREIGPAKAVKAETQPAAAVVEQPQPVPAGPPLPPVKQEAEKPVDVAPEPAKTP